MFVCERRKDEKYFYFIAKNVTDVEDTLIKRLYKPHSFKRVNEYCTKVHLYF